MESKISASMVSSSRSMRSIFSLMHLFGMSIVGLRMLKNLRLSRISRMVSRSYDLPQRLLPPVSRQHSSRDAAPMVRVEHIQLEGSTSS